MGVRLLIGEYDGTTEAAVMVDSVSGTAFGPIFEGIDPVDEIEAFQRWLARLGHIEAAERGFLILDSGEMPKVGTDGADPRHWPDAGLVKVVQCWRRNVGVALS